MSRLPNLPAGVASLVLMLSPAWAQTPDLIGKEVSTYQRLEDGEEFTISLEELLERGQGVFEAQFTPSQGGGRPQSNGFGSPLADPTSPLVFPRNFNRVSAMDGNACAGCHNAPFGIVGGGAGFAGVTFVGAFRFDFATFDQTDLIPLRGAVENSQFVTLQDIGNLRAPIGFFGSGFIEMLARQITADLQAIRDATGPGESNALISKGISFGIISRDGSGQWDVSGVEGLPPQSLIDDPPSLIIQPFIQSGLFASLRQPTAIVFNNHVGMQATELFGIGTDPDQDGVFNELTRADITAAVIFMATRAVPGQVIPGNQEVKDAIEDGSFLFEQIGCASCHIPALPLDNEGWIFTEPNPFNPPGQLQVGDAPTLSVDLTSDDLPGERPEPEGGVVIVQAYTDLKLHDITTGPGDPNEEALDFNQGGTPGFFDGNRRFLTKKLWGAANERPYFHHGKFTTLREATLAHAGEALAARDGFVALTDLEQDHVIEFLKSLQVLPPEKTKTKPRNPRQRP